MSNLHVTASTTISAEARIVRAQFADVAHHAATHPHRGVRFEIIEDTPDRCRYRQTTRVGPLQLHQELELDRAPVGPLVNRVISGQFAGGTISFDIAATDDHHTGVVARVDAELTGPQRLVAPLVKRSVRRALVRALAEDKQDLESGTYPATTEPAV